ncbi:Cysteine/Histidine-rich C1 domain family protein [Quillaja saponaria]|uniref:Cysteine/Histidine-rich C1 domain family protein n=1 Tax=Quillaja saponaria TaxID=32244 RepID=A0AAD7LNS9_QUISA|nr:Cysteine/Histidine-rich C1 domain family protein [Quillaja saponaria]
MAPVKRTTSTRTIEHFTHPTHPLSFLSQNTEFLCDGCKILGTGNRYRCNTCDYDLHEFCATCPSSFSCFLHPKHQLNLVMRKSQGARQIERLCDVCGTHVNGLFYRCKFCEFDVHPLCTQLPEHMRHAYHPNHLLKLQPVSSGWCVVCKSDCESWAYSCRLCRVDVHLQCLDSTLPPAPALTQAAASSYSATAVYADRVYSGSGSGSGSSSGSVSYVEYENLNLTSQPRVAPANSYAGGVYSNYKTPSPSPVAASSYSVVYADSGSDSVAYAEFEYENVQPITPAPSAAAASYSTVYADCGSGTIEYTEYETVGLNQRGGANVDDVAYTLSYLHLQR